MHVGWMVAGFMDSWVNAGLLVGLILNGYMLFMDVV